MNIIKQLLPYSIIILYDRYRELRKYQINLSKVNFWDYGKLLVHIKCAKLYLLPKKRLKNLATFIDIGANVGDWSFHIKSLYPEANLLAFEPEPASYEVLKERLKLMKPILINVALGNQKGMLDFFVTKDTTGSSLLEPNDTAREAFGNKWTTKKVKVIVDKLDSYTKTLSQIDVLKIDVQGYEELVFEGGEETLKKTNFIIIELNFIKLYDSGVDFIDIHRILTQKYGFELSNLSQPMVIAGKAFMADALYANTSFK